MAPRENGPSSPDGSSDDSRNNRDQSYQSNETNPFVAFRHHVDTQLNGILARLSYQFPTLQDSESRWQQRVEEARNEAWRRFEASYERATNPERRQTESRGRMDPVNPSAKRDDQRESRGWSWGPWGYSWRRWNEPRQVDQEKDLSEKQWDSFWNELRDAKNEGRPVRSGCPAFNGAVARPAEQDDEHIEEAYRPDNLSQDQQLRGHLDWDAAYRDLQQTKQVEPRNEFEWVNELEKQVLSATNESFKTFFDFFGIGPLPSQRERSGEGTKRLEMQADESQRSLAEWCRLMENEATANGARDETANSHVEATSSDSTELDMYNEFLGRDDRSAPLTNQPALANPANSENSVLSTMTRVERTVNLDGTITTRRVLRKRFADGSEEENDTTETSRDTSLQSMTPPRSANDNLRGHGGSVVKALEESKKQQSQQVQPYINGEQGSKPKQPKLQGWFWSN